MASQTSSYTLGRSNVLSSSSFTSFATSLDTDTSSSSSEPSLYTVTSSRTVWGPGALTGKALLAFGKMTLRGIEHQVIQRRLAVLSSRFPHVDEAPDVEHMYDDVLELTRPGLYGVKIRQQALRLVLIQIATGKTVHLIRSLVKWPCVEMELFLSEIMACMHPQWTGLGNVRQSMHVGLMDEYLHSQYNQNGHGATPFVNFVRNLALSGKTPCRAVLDAGFLGMVLCMYLHDFLPSGVSHSEAHWISRRFSLLVACNETLGAIATSEKPEISQRLIGHPLYVLWPNPLRTKGKFLERGKVWRTLERSLVSWRLGTILNVIFLSSASDVPVATDDALDALGDLLEFASSDILDSEASDRALKYLFGCIDHSTGNVERAMIMYLERDFDGTLDVLTRVIDRVLHIAEPSQQFRSSLPDSTHGQIVHPIDNFVEFAVRVADGSNTTNSKQVFLDAGILSLLLAMLADELKDLNSKPTLLDSDQTLDACDSDTSTLLDSNEFNNSNSTPSLLDSDQTSEACRVDSDTSESTLLDSTELNDSNSTPSLLDVDQTACRDDSDTSRLLNSIRSQGVKRLFKNAESVFPYRRRILCGAFRLFYDSPDVYQSSLQVWELRHWIRNAGLV